MNQLDNAFGDNNNNNGVPNPVVIMGQNPSVWLGPNYDEEAQKNGEQKANGNENNMNPQTWETINRQIQQNEQLFCDILIAVSSPIYMFVTCIQNLMS